MNDVSNKENVLRTPTTLNKRKSYSILSPVTSSYNLNKPVLRAKQDKIKNERVISESTGLVKFALSTSKPPSSLSSPFSSTPSQNTSTSVTPVRSGLPVYIPIDNKVVHKVQKEETDYRFIQDELLQQYAQIQREMMEYEKKIELCKFELLEISTKLESCKRDEMVAEIRKQRTPSNDLDLYKKVHQQTESQINSIEKEFSVSHPEETVFIDSLKKRASTVFSINNSNVNNVQTSEIELKLNTLKNKASTMFNASNITNTFEELSQNVNKKASTIFQVPSKESDIQGLLNSSNEKFDEISHKTSKFFNDVVNNLSPKKTESTNKNTLFNTKINYTLNNLSKNFNLNFNKKQDEDQEKELIFNSSFNFDNLNLNETPITEVFLPNDDNIDSLRIIYEDDDDQDIVDIDDCNSSFEDH